jgi:hypothetical protein
MEHEDNPQQPGSVNNGNAGNNLNAGAAAFEPLAANNNPHNGGERCDFQNFGRKTPAAGLPWPKLSLC